MLSEEAAAAVRSAEEQLAKDNPQKVVKGELRAQRSGASGFRKRAASFHRCHGEGEAGGGELPEDRVKALYDAETPAAAAELGIEGVEEIDQIVDLDEEGLATMSDDEREMVMEALTNEGSSGCLTTRQAGRLVLVAEDDDLEEIEGDRGQELKAAGLSSSGRKAVARRSKRAPAAARRPRSVTVTGKKTTCAPGADRAVARECGSKGPAETAADGKEMPVVSQLAAGDDSSVLSKRKRGTNAKPLEPKEALRIEGSLLSAATKSTSLLDFFNRKPTGSKAQQREEAADSRAADKRNGGNEDCDDGSRDGQTRKKIKKMMSDKKLSATTKEARKMEADRRKKLEELQSIAGDVPEDPEGRVLINGRVPEEEPVWLCKALSDKLKEHQVEGIRFMWDNLVVSLEDFSTDDSGLGAILAHSMGLGKTLQVVSFLHTLLKNPVVRASRDHTEGLKPIKTALVIAPVNTLSNWEAEFSKWLPSLSDQLNIYNFETAGQTHKARWSMIRQWHRGGGVLIAGYEMFRAMTKMDNSNRVPWKTEVVGYLMDPGPDVVVADEAHVIKNFQSDISKQLKLIRTRRRLALTGSPLQNNLLEYHCMVDFVREHFLGTRTEFCNQYVNPIANGQAADSTKADVRLMKRRAHVLHNKLQGFVQRKDASVLEQELPRKNECVLHVRLSPLQRELYAAYMNKMQGLEPGQLGGVLFKAYQSMLRVWNHPYVMHAAELTRPQLTPPPPTSIAAPALAPETAQAPPSPQQQQQQQQQQHAPPAQPAPMDGDGKDVIVNLITPEKSPRPREDELSPAPAEAAEGMVAAAVEGKENYGPGLATKDAPALPPGRLSGLSLVPVEGTVKDEEAEAEWMSPPREEETPGEAADGDQNLMVSPTGTGSGERGGGGGGTRGGSGGSCWEEHTAEEEGQGPATSEATEAEGNWWRSLMGDSLAEISKECMDYSGKAVLLMAIIQEAGNRGEKVLVFSQSLGTITFLQNFMESVFKWRSGHELFRIDGSMNSKTRRHLVSRFNNERNTVARAFLISTKAGALGINLVGANHCVLFDSSWNPATDSQAIFRIYRYGQKKPVHVYRLLAAGTMEAKIYRKQVVKGGLSASVVDDQQVSRHFTGSEIGDMLKFQPSEDEVAREVVSAEEVGGGPPQGGPPEAKDTLGARGSVLRAILRAHGQRWVSRWHQHEPLLADQASEHLTSAEKALACWEEENEVQATRQIGSSDWQEYRQKSGRLLYYHLGRGLERSAPVDIASASSDADTAERMLEPGSESCWKPQPAGGDLLAAPWVVLDLNEPTGVGRLEVTVPINGNAPSRVRILAEVSGSFESVGSCAVNPSNTTQAWEFMTQVCQRWRLEFHGTSGAAGTITVHHVRLLPGTAAHQQHLGNPNQQQQGRPQSTGRSAGGWVEMLIPSSGNKFYIHFGTGHSQWAPPDTFRLAYAVT